jgi:hypothetical protein
MYPGLITTLELVLGAQVYFIDLGYGRTHIPDTRFIPVTTLMESWDPHESHWAVNWFYLSLNQPAHFCNQVLSSHMRVMHNEPNWKPITFMYSPLQELSIGILVENFHIWFSIFPFLHLKHFCFLLQLDKQRRNSPRRRKMCFSTCGAQRQRKN